MRQDEIDSAKAKLITPPHTTPAPNSTNRVMAINMRSDVWPAIKAHEWARALLQLPPDTTIVRVTEVDYMTTTAMLLRSSEFDEVPEFELPPEIRVNITRESVGDLIKTTRVDLALP